MPFNLSGVFQRLYSWATDRDSAVKISASRMDGEFNGIADGLTAVVQQTQPFKGAIKSTSGTAALPGYTFDGDLNTGVYRPGADQVAVSLNGTQRLLMTTAAATWGLPQLLPDGTTGAPAVAFTGAPTTGIYRSAGSGNMFFQVGGAGGFVATGQGLTVGSGATLQLDGRIEIGGDGNLIPLVVATGTANALAVTVPMISPKMFWMFAPVTNTGSTTLSINGGAAVTLRTPSGVNLPAGYTRFSSGASQPILVVFSGSDWLAIRGIESGTSGASSWTKFPDGRLECSSGLIEASVAATSHAEVTWNYPSPFVASPDVAQSWRTAGTPANIAANMAAGCNCAVSVGSSSAVAILRNGTGSALTMRTHLTASGRWF